MRLDQLLMSNMTYRRDDPHSKRTLAPKIGAADDPECLAEFARTHWYCQACGKSGTHTIHHIIGGRGGRADEPCNLLYLCWEPCHMLAEELDVREIFKARNEEFVVYLPKITLAIAIAMKNRAGEMDQSDLARLAVLHGRALPDPEPIPAWFLNKSRSNRPEFEGKT